MPAPLVDGVALPTAIVVVTFDVLELNAPPTFIGPAILEAS